MNVCSNCGRTMDADPNQRCSNGGICKPIMASEHAIVPDDLRGIYAKAVQDGPEYYAHLTQGLIERIGRVERELQLVDESLARRPAVAEAPNRYTAICSAFEMASRAQRAEAMEKHWKFHYEKLKAEYDEKR